MRIITWNVRCGNKKIQKLLTYALSHKPDILCLQEVPYPNLQFLKTIHGYHLVYIYDFQNRYYTDKNAYICTLSRIKPLRSKIVRYFHKHEKSILNRFLYQIILHKLEQHDAIVLTIKIHTKQYSIINARLSSAVGTENRLEQFQHLLNRIPKGTIPFICGDLNIVDGRFFNWTTGWLRGFRLKDYKLNERKTFETLVAKTQLINLFYKINTCIYRPFKFQFDHILTPRDIPILRKEISKKSFGSDHNMLLVDIDV